MLSIYSEYLKPITLTPWYHGGRTCEAASEHSLKEAAMNCGERLFSMFARAWRMLICVPFIAASAFGNGDCLNLAEFAECLAGPDIVIDAACVCADPDLDDDSDLADAWLYQVDYDGPCVEPGPPAPQPFAALRRQGDAAAAVKDAEAHQRNVPQAVRFESRVKAARGFVGDEPHRAVP